MIEPAAPHELFAISVSGTYMSPYEVTRDGQRFLVLSAQEEVSQSSTMIVKLAEAAEERSRGALNCRVSCCCFSNPAKEASATQTVFCAVNAAGRDC